MEYLAWPLAALVFAIIALFVFKRNVASLIDRVRKIDKHGITTAGGEQAQSVPDTKPNNFQELMDSTSSPLLRQRENAIKDALKARGIMDEKETAKLLTRALAESQLTRHFEAVDRTIFGTQLGILIELNASSSGLPPERLREFYDSATKQNPPFFQEYSFDQYLGYLLDMQLVVRGGRGYQISLEGKEFMVWLVQSGRTHARAN